MDFVDHRRPSCIGLVLVSLLTFGACDQPLPRDSRETTERIASTRALRVGVTENPPWVVRGPDGQPSGPEVQLVLDLARETNARVEWRWGQLESLLLALRGYELDLVAGGIDAETPWEDRVGLTEPWRKLSHGRELVIAVPPGENRWLGRVDQFLHDHGARP